MTYEDLEGETGAAEPETGAGQGDTGKLALAERTMLLTVLRGGSVTELIGRLAPKDLNADVNSAALLFGALGGDGIEWTAKQVDAVTALAAAIDKKMLGIEDEGKRKGVRARTIVRRQRKALGEMLVRGPYLVRMLYVIVEEMLRARFSKGSFDPANVDIGIKNTARRIVSIMAQGGTVAEVRVAVISNLLSLTDTIAEARTGFTTALRGRATEQSGAQGYDVDTPIRGQGYCHKGTTVAAQVEAVTPEDTAPFTGEIGEDEGDGSLEPLQTESLKAFLADVERIFPR